jgi:hypothetical protein
MSCLSVRTCVEGSGGPADASDEGSDDDARDTPDDGAGVCTYNAISV